MAFLFTGPCLAAAAWMTESGGADMGMASAGRAAIAADATTVAANPAGMAALTDDGFLVAALPAAMDLELQGSGATAGTVDDRAGPMPVAALFGTHGAGRWTLGLGVYSYLGLGFDFGADWAGSRAIEDVRLRSMNLAPAAAYRLTDRLAVGGTLGAQYMDMRAGLGVANDAMFYGPPAGLPDGHLRLTGSNWAVNGSLGLAFQVSDDMRIGLAWHSRVKHSVDLDLRGEDLHPVLDAIVQQQTARLDLTVPQQLTFSVTRQVTPRHAARRQCGMAAVVRTGPVATSSWAGTWRPSLTTASVTPGVPRSACVTGSTIAGRLPRASPTTATRPRRTPCPCTFRWPSSCGSPWASTTGIRRNCCSGSPPRSSTRATSASPRNPTPCRCREYRP